MFNNKPSTDWYKNVEMPEVTDFNDFFTDTKDYRSEDIPEHGHRFLVLQDRAMVEVENKPKHGEFMAVGNYLSVRDGDSLWVKPAEMLFEYIRTRLLFIAYDTINFKIVDHKDGTGKLIVASSRLLRANLIGSRWMTVKLDMATVPHSAKSCECDHVKSRRMRQ